MILNYILKNKAPLAKFVGVGLFTFFFNNFLFYCFYSVLGLEYRLAITLAYWLIVIMHFYLNRNFTFSSLKGRTIGAAVPRYAILLMINYCISLLSAFLVVEILHISPFYAIPIATFFTASTSFIAMNHFVFYVRTK
jgi:hypothetical protein